MTTKRSERLNRILLMVPFIVGSEGVPLDELCGKFEVSREELMGDLQTLQLCGVPEYTPADLIDYWIEGDRVRVVFADFFKRPLTLTREEAVAIFVSGHALISSGVFPQEGALASALEKVGRLLSEDEKEEVRGVIERIRVEMSAYKDRWNEIIEEGIQNDKDLLIEYFSFSRDEMGSREVEPLSLLWSKGHWYLYAWCHEAEDTRLFRMDRIKSVSLTDRKASRGSRKAPAAPELIGEYKPDKKAHHVKLKFTGSEGRRLVEEWPTARVTEGGGGAVKIELRTRNLSWLANYLLKFGDRMTVESPGELRKMVEEKAEALLKEYVWR
jgi:proteasome accessory factor C